MKISKLYMFFVPLSLIAIAVNFSSAKKKLLSLSSNSKGEFKRYKRLEYLSKKDLDNEQLKIYLIMKGDTFRTSGKELKLNYPYYMELNPSDKNLEFCSVEKDKIDVNRIICKNKISFYVELNKEKHTFIIRSKESLSPRKDYWLSINMPKQISEGIYQINAFSQSNKEVKKFDYFGSWRVTVDGIKE